MNDTQIKCYESFGHIINETTNIMFYNLDNLSLNSILDYSNNLDFKIKEFSYENKPNFKDNLSYKNGLVWVYNPNDTNGSFEDVEYTRKWRYIHELSHGLTHTYILDKFNISVINRGEGILSYNDAIIALSWEIETMILQFKILKDLGVIVSKINQNREINTLFADLVYRCVTGEFTNPDLSGFVPSDEPLKEWKNTVLNIYLDLDLYYV